MNQRSTLGFPGFASVLLKNPRIDGDGPRNGVTHTHSHVSPIPMPKRAQEEPHPSLAERFERNPSSRTVSIEHHETSSQIRIDSDLQSVLDFPKGNDYFSLFRTPLITSSDLIVMTLGGAQLYFPGRRADDSRPAMRMLCLACVRLFGALEVYQTAYHVWVTIPWGLIPRSFQPSFFSTLGGFPWFLEAF